MNKLFSSDVLPETLLFGRYKLIRCLSVGQFAGVYLSLDTFSNNKKIVLKVVSREQSSDYDHLASFRKEVELSHCIKHDNILGSIQVYSDDEFLAYTMEYMEGGTLADLLQDKVRLDFQEIVDILLQICSGVNAIHEQAIIHRDLKPENLLIDLAGHLKIADFGIAANLSSSANSVTDDIIGSVNYLSPEYIERGVCDHRSDIYSIGVIAYQLVTGRLPFEGETLIETLTARVIHDPIAPKKLLSQIPESLNHFILRALQRNPPHRFQRVTAMIKALEEIKEDISDGETATQGEFRGGLLPSKPPLLSPKRLLL